MVWHHATMNNEIADELVVKGNERLLRNGICLGTECSFPTFMGLGMTMDESLLMMQDMDVAGQTHRKGEPEFEETRSRLRHILLHRFPEAIAKDQRMWDATTA
jgi:hypothetical protein